MIARRRFRVMLVALIVVGAMAPVEAASEPTQTLAAVIHAAARWGGVPPELLTAVVWVESRGRPWALNIRGKALYPRTRAEARALLQAALGHADIGVAQIHYPIWGPVLGLQPEDLLDPWINLHAAAAILRLVMAREPDSWGGVGRYHSGTPRRKWTYARRVGAVVHAQRPTSPRVWVTP
jgi:soluble lytic murein transglycosylase-like protein